MDGVIKKIDVVSLRPVVTKSYMGLVGTFQTVQFKRSNASGSVWEADGQEVIIPSGGDVSTEQPIDAFIYMGSDGRLMGSLNNPKAVAGEFAVLQVVDVNDDGAFLDLGIEKDVFAPNSEQKRPMRKGESYVVRVYVNERNSRLQATSRLADFVPDEEPEFEIGEEVMLYIADPGDLGYNAIVNKKFLGLLYHNELYEHLHPGEIRKGFIKKIREGNKIDLSLNPIGFDYILDSKELILGKLEENGGLLPLGDKSAPAEVYRLLKISKKAFKKALGGLYKDRLIEISDFETRRLGATK